jgi:hypothetical protein
MASHRAAKLPSHPSDDGLVYLIGRFEMREVPGLTDTGDFTVKLANTTHNLTGVYFDTADKTRNAMFYPQSQSFPNTNPPGHCTALSATHGPQRTLS